MVVPGVYKGELIHPCYKEMQKENHTVAIPWRAAEIPRLKK